MTIKINGVTCGKKGVKGPDGKYVPVWYHVFTPLSSDKVHVTISAKRCCDYLPKELGQVENQTDIMTDYFESDRVRFAQGSKEFDLLRSVIGCAA